MKIPSVPDALNRWLILRWSNRGRCDAMHPDHRAKLRCVEPPRHAGDHTATMVVRW